MNKKLTFACMALLGAMVLVSACKSKPAPEPEKLGVENMAYKWGKIALEATANDTGRFKPRPTVTSRILALIFTSVYDAWTRYDEVASPVYLSGVERRPETERTQANKETAISYAAYRAMMEYFWADSSLWKQQMTELGFDPENRSLDPATPEGIGNLAVAQGNPGTPAKINRFNASCPVLKQKMSSIGKVRRFWDLFPVAFSSAFSGN